MLLGMDIVGKTLGLVGFGRIGRAVAKRAAGFDLRVIYYDRSETQPGPDLKATQVDFETLLEESDFISLHTPMTPDTRHMIDSEALSKMKSTCASWSRCTCAWSTRFPWKRKTGEWRWSSRGSAASISSSST